jgi:biotin operon repressor
MAAIWELELPRNEKLVALCFADFANDQGECFPSLDRVAWKTGYSRRQAYSLVQALRARGILVPQDARRGRSRTVIYRVCPEKGAKIAPFGECAGPHKKVQSSVERVRPAAQKGAVATAPYPSVTVKSSQPSGSVTSKSSVLPGDTHPGSGS